MIMTYKSPDCANDSTNLHEFELSQLTCLHLSEDEYSKWDEYDNDMKKLFSVTEIWDNGRCSVYHLMQNLVWTDTEHNTKIYACDDCTKSLKKHQIPSVSIAAGYDFGCTWIYGLPELTLAEKALIGLVRVHADILKLSAPFNLNDDTRHNALKGHVFATRHDGPIQAATVLPRLNANDMVYYKTKLN